MLKNDQFLKLVCAARDSANPQMTDEIARALISIVDYMANKPQWRIQPNIEDYKAEALVQLMRLWTRFDPDKSSQPIAYFCQVALCAFHKCICHDDKARDLHPYSLTSWHD